MRVLAIHYGNHDANACIYDGEVKHYFLEERFSRKKHDDKHFHIYKNILKVDEPVDLIVLSYFGDKTFLGDDSLKFTKVFLEAYKRKHGKLPEIIKDSSHHKFHAVGAYYNSGFDDALVVVIDGAGGLSKGLFEAETVFIGGSFERVYENKIKLYPWMKGHSMMGLGYLYSAAAVQMGERCLQAGKVMGLSAYGDAHTTHIKDDLYVDDDLFHCKDIHLMFYDENHMNIAQELYGKKGLDTITGLTQSNYKPYADFAKEVQIDTQNVVIKLVRESLEKTGLHNVCMTGGYAMNIITNNLLVETFPDVEFYFEPMSTDVGISVGAAMLYSKERTPLKTTSFHGWKYDLSTFRGTQTLDAKGVAKLLQEQRSIGTYFGYAEAGQRALGNRSILFNPFVVDGREIVNRIKKREWYRPFAASVLQEDAHLYFDMKTPSRFMTQCYTVKSDISIPAVTHIDNTCRVQTVTDGILYELLSELKKLTGHGIILNTSFNLAGEPLVETPQQALDILSRCELDYVWFPETMQLFS